MEVEVPDRGERQQRHRSILAESARILPKLILSAIPAVEARDLPRPASRRERP